MELRPLVVGEKVEMKVRRKTSGLGDSWFPTTVSEVLDEQNYGVVLGGKTPERQQKVGRDKIRPADGEHFPPETTLEPRAAVEAFWQGAWSKGEVVRCVGDSSGRYLVKLGSKRRMATTEPEIMELKDLRPPPSNKKTKEGILNLDEVQHDSLPALLPSGLEPTTSEDNGYSGPQNKSIVAAVCENPASQDSAQNMSGKADHGPSRKVITHLKRLRKKTGSSIEPSCSQQSSLGATPTVCRMDWLA